MTRIRVSPFRGVLFAANLVAIGVFVSVAVHLWQSEVERVETGLRNATYLQAEHLRERVESFEPLLIGWARASREGREVFAELLAEEGLHAPRAQRLEPGATRGYMLGEARLAHLLEPLPLIAGDGPVLSLQGADKAVVIALHEQTVVHARWDPERWLSEGAREIAPELLLLARSPGEVVEGAPGARLEADAEAIVRTRARHHLEGVVAVEGGGFGDRSLAAFRHLDGHLGLVVARSDYESIALNWAGAMAPAGLLLAAFLGVAALTYQRLIRAHNDAEHRLIGQAREDALTGVPNRLALNERLEALSHAAARGESRATVILVDLDDFKRINDQHGHSTGDALLRQVAERLASVLAGHGELYRFGGDEFVGIIADPGTGEVAEVTEALLASLRGIFPVGEHRFRTAASIGYAHLPEDARTAEAALSCADLALYQAKALGRDLAVSYTHELSESLRRRAMIEGELERALEREELALYVQPQMDAKTGFLRGCEVLIRWDNRLMGRVSPGEFIPVAEAMGDIQYIDQWVVREACERWAPYLDNAPGAFHVSINLSGATLQRPEAVQYIIDDIARLSVPPARIVFEVTETELIEQPRVAARSVSLLREAGFQVALDDFGTGYSSLSLLQRLPVSELKIDQSFISGMIADKRRLELVDTLILLGHRLNLRVVAEGVEESEEADVLADMNCDLIQGYYYDAPMRLATLVHRYGLD